MRIYVVSMVDLHVQNAERTHLLEKWSNVARFGNDVTLWCLRKGKHPVKTNDLRIVRVPYIPIRGVADVTYQLALTLGLFWSSLLRRPDVIYIRNSSLDLAPILVSVVLQIAMVLEVPSHPLEEARFFKIKGLKLWLVKTCFKLKLKLSRVVITVASGIRSELLRHYSLSEERVFVIANGANTTLFSPRSQDEARRELNLTSQLYVGFVGMMYVWHGLHFLVAASPLVLEEFPNVRFMLVGEGATRDELMNETQRLGVFKNFLFLGSVPYERVPTYISACDVMVLPLVSKEAHDSGYSPLKLYEYMSCGKPTIASRLSGLEILEKHRCGILVPPADPPALARAIVSILGNRSLGMEMGSNARKAAQQFCDWSLAAQRTMQTLVRVIQAS